MNSITKNEKKIPLSPSLPTGDEFSILLVDDEFEDEPLEVDIGLGHRQQVDVTLALSYLKHLALQAKGETEEG